MTNQIAVYDEFRGQLAELRLYNEKVFFNYEDPKGNKEARSHVYKLRQTKAAIDKARKAEKEDVLLRGRLIDSEAKEIISEIEVMIDVHQKPLDEIEQREQTRIDVLKQRIATLAVPSILPENSSELKKVIKSIQSIIIDNSFSEFVAEAGITKDDSIKTLNTYLESALKREAQEAELNKLRIEAESKAREEREEAIRKEAAEKATREAETKASVERERQYRQELELKLATEKAQREKVEAEQKAAHAVEEERKRVAEEQAALAAEEAKREANKKHKEKIHNEIIKALNHGGSGLAIHICEQVIETIKSGKVPHVRITY